MVIFKDTQLYTYTFLERYLENTFVDWISEEIKKKLRQTGKEEWHGQDLTHIMDNMFTGNIYEKEDW